ncbi:YfbM family protein [Aquisphaera insulae]|uniref:YfbM family protein n=1 Tax=Aquisphaera insulae TaxID=2712864 RepID=UPI0013EBEB66|nr:YfbM family protein [Aquisphaera insulae]
MACRGVHFALIAAEVEHLRSLTSERARIDYVVEYLEDTYFSGREEFLARSDKAWDAMHRCLADGELTWDGGDYPLNHVILAGELLYTEDDYILSLKTPEQVRDIAAALPGVTEEEFRRRYYTIDEGRYGMPPDEEDFGYTWEWFQDVRRLYLRAAAEGRHVLFAVDQ